MASTSPRSSRGEDADVSRRGRADQRLNPALRQLAHLVTRYDRRLLIHRSYQDRLREIYGQMVLDTVGLRTALLREDLKTMEEARAFTPPTRSRFGEHWG